MVLLFADPHFGVQGFNKSILKKQISYFQDIVFPYILENNIKEVVCLGDFFDNRTILDIVLLNEVKEKIIDFFNQNRINLHLIAGNHDIYYKSSKEFNSIKIFESEFIKVYQDNFHEVEIENLKCCIVPWIIDKSDFQLNDSFYDLILGHFDFDGFLYNKFMIANTDFSHNKIKNHAKLVLSGHYHIRSKKDNVIYLGSPYHLNWNDFNTKKGFYVIDQSKLKFIENHYSPRFIKIYYEEKENNIELKVLGIGDKDFLKVEPKEVYQYTKNNIIKLIINNIINQNLFDVFYKNILQDNFQEKIETINFNDSLGSLDDISNIENISEENILESTLKVIKSIETNLDKELLSSIFTEVFKDAEKLKLEKEK